MLKISTLNDLNVRLFDIGNAYLKAGTYEKLYFNSGKKFGTDMDCSITAVIQDIYGFQPDGESIHSNMTRKLMYGLRFQECPAKLDTCIQPYLKAGGFKYYQYISTHIDKKMTIGNDCENIINGLEDIYMLGEEKGRFDENPHCCGKTLYDQM